VIGEKTLDVHVGDLTIPTRFVVSSNVTEPMLGINWLRANRIIWDFAKDLLIVNGEVFDMILEERRQELKRRKWLEGIDDENESQRDSKNAKKVKTENMMEIKIINRVRAVPLPCEFNVNIVDCIFSQVPAVRDNDIRYPCFLCGPSTSGFSRARDLMRHSVSNHDLFPSGVEQGEHYSCDGRDLTKPTVEQYEKYKDGSHRGKEEVRGERES